MATSLNGSSTVDPSRLDSTLRRSAIANRIGRSAIANRIGFAAIAMWMVVLVHHPVDSTLVEAGDGLWCVFVAIPIAAAGWILFPPNVTAAWGELVRRPQRLLAMPVVWFVGLVVWLWVAWWFTCEVGSYRKGLNEWWWWVTAAASLIVGKTWVRPGHEAAWAALMVACATMLAMHGLHGHFVVLPDLWAQYRADPDEVLRSAGMNAPPGSAARMIFENRLFDGGASATFALANSLGGFLVLSVPLAVGLFVTNIRTRFRHPEREEMRTSEWRTRLSTAIPMPFVIALMLVAIFVTRSRAAVIATLVTFLVTACWLLFRRRAKDENEERLTENANSFSRVQRSVAVLAAFVVVSGAVALGIASFGRAEWVDAAPASLATRIRYWRATAALASERPWFGAGPGNFQALSERFREGVSSEQIADPHNFFWETVGAGGWPAGLWLVGFCIALIVALVKLHRSSDMVIKKESLRSSDSGSVAANSSSETTFEGLRIGFVLGLVGVWAFRWIDGVVELLPYACDLVGLAALFLATSRIKQTRPGGNVGLRGFFVLSLVGITLHLSVSGGWTVPGIAVPLLVTIGSLLSVPASFVARDSSELQVPLPQRLAGPIALASVLMLLAYFTSWRPVTGAQAARTAAEYWMYEGSISAAKASLEDAIRADPFDTQSALYRADLLRRELIVRPSRSRQAIENWTRAVEVAKRAGGQSPPLYRQLGDQAISVYQRFGHPTDLILAKRFYEFAVQFGPSEEVAWAQYAMILNATGEAVQARKAAERAVRLSAMTPNPERDLARHTVQLIRPITAPNGRPETQDAATAMRSLLEPEDANEVR